VTGGPGPADAPGAPPRPPLPAHQPPNTAITGLQHHFRPLASPGDLRHLPAGLLLIRTVASFAHPAPYVPAPTGAGAGPPVGRRAARRSCGSPRSDPVRPTTRHGAPRPRTGRAGRRRGSAWSKTLDVLADCGGLSRSQPFPGSPPGRGARHPRHPLGHVRPHRPFRHAAVPACCRPQ
jgi:hypothetical protein